MVTLELTQDERRVLAEMLEQLRGEMTYEISDTDRLAYRNELKSRRALIERLIEAIRLDA